MNPLIFNNFIQIQLSFLSLYYSETVVVVEGFVGVMKTKRIIESQNFIFQTWKFMEVNMGHGK